MNPPYSDAEHPCKADRSKCKKKRCQKRGYHIDQYVPGCYDFVKKAAEEARKGSEVVCLLAARTDNSWWHEFVYDAEARRYRPGVSVEFIPGRLKFNGAKNSAPFPSVLVIFRP
jgi:site-specific DNA-methyltransferase (adenine-specific)